MVAPPKPPDFDELELLITEARERPLRRRLLGAAAFTIAAALGLSIYILVIGKVSDGAERPVNGGRVGAPLCRASQLSATAGLNGAVGGMVGPVTLTNTSGNACSLPTGRPRVHIVWHGRTLAAREKGGMDISGATPARLLVPNSSAAIYLDWSDWCGRPSEGTIIRPTFELRWADGLGVDAPNQPMTPPRCGSPAGGSVIAVSAPMTHRAGH
jgi:Protein of unknown function (DUF4232)